MVLVSIRLRVPPEKRDEVLGTIRRFIEPTCVQPGCQGFRCLQDAADGTALVVEERWASQEDLERHIRSSDFRSFLGLLELAVERPIVEFHDVAKTSGMVMID